MDWKDQLGALLSEGSLPQGEEPRTEERVESAPSVQKEPLHVVVERKGRKGKTATIVEGFLCDDETLKETAAKLKQKLGTGGSARGGEILIQGDVAEKAKAILRSLGYKVKG